jgi:iron-sulfur cluster assembly accessory protein
MDAVTPVGEKQAAPEAETIVLTNKAVSKVADLLKQEDQDYYLRVAVQPGGCSGLRYAIYFDDREMDGDVVQSFGDITLKVDRLSAPYLKGASLDWLEGLEQSGFTIDNPNVSGTCACGDSFH